VLVNSQGNGWRWADYLNRLDNYWWEIREGEKLEDLVGNAKVFDVVSTDVTLRYLPELTPILQLEQSERDVCSKYSMPT